MLKKQYDRTYFLSLNSTSSTESEKKMGGTSSDSIYEQISDSVREEYGYYEVIELPQTHAHPL